uniref:Uncharacterized protein n=1 Tax=Utricularia reniformis TaxID=192314 RepID=A0A1Y0B0M4_9LAMI|nr:hypothetical protein AEK19_MT0763 [Utricularia reniformis]ART31006.1 hypothetical protein AEK19_MT0763 [Utricularia reniformis]
MLFSFNPLGIPCHLELKCLLLPLQVEALPVRGLTRVCIYQTSDPSNLFSFICMGYT